MLALTPLASSPIAMAEGDGRVTGAAKGMKSLKGLKSLKVWGVPTRAHFLRAPYEVADPWA
jgi:hypothetical protein